MRIGVLKESEAGERRVALVPDAVKRLLAKKIEVMVQSGAGVQAGVTDEEYSAAGATVSPSAAALCQGVDGVLKIQAPTPAEIALLKQGTVLISLLSPLTNLDLVQKLAQGHIAAVSVDSIPRTTLAQMMDVLSSQATLAGYRAVLLAAHALPRFFPMMMTAAGTIAPARALILGAGVAGLQAIATARRLGAVVEAFDVRKVAKEQVESLGAKFIQVDPEEDAQTAGGYAGEVSAEYKRKQADLIKGRLAAADVCITTALIPGQQAPVLITEDMVRGMRRGSVIVDLAIERGGNCELTQPDQVVERHGVTLIGYLNLPSQMAVHASQMYSRNMEKLLVHLFAGGGGAAELNRDDEIVRGCLITGAGDRTGEVVHEGVLTRLRRQPGRES